MARPKKLPQILSREEAGALLAQPNPRYATGARNRALLATFYRAGLRCSEALNLRPRDVQLARHEIRVNDGKGGKDRVVPIEETLAEWLDRWRSHQDRPKRADWFFCTLKGERLDDGYVRTMVARYGVKAGIGIRCHPHILRHCFATEMLQDGADIYEVQDVLGHEDLETTTLYLHLSKTRLRKTIQGRSWQPPKHARKR